MLVDEKMFEIKSDMQLIKVTQAEYDKMYELNPELIRDENDPEQESLVKVKAKLDFDDYQEMYVLEIFKKGNKVNTDMKMLEIEEDKSASDDPSLVGC